MRKQQVLLTAAALSLGLSAIPALAASSSGDTKAGAGGSAATQLNCNDLKGPARDTCLEQQKNTARTPGRSEGSASREAGQTPGRSDDAASRTGTPPGKFDSSPAGAPAAGGAPKDSTSSPKK
jgi:hypothetical protein